MGSSLSQDPRGQGAAPWSVWGTCEHTQPGLGRGPELHFPQEVACCSKALGFGRILPVSKAMRFVVSACSMRWGAYWMLGGGGYSELPDRQGRDAPQPYLPPQHEPRTGCAACPPTQAQDGCPVKSPLSSGVQLCVNRTITLLVTRAGCPAITSLTMGEVLVTQPGPGSPWAAQSPGHWRGGSEGPQCPVPSRLGRSHTLLQASGLWLCPHV